MYSSCPLSKVKRWFLRQVRCKSHEILAQLSGNLEQAAAGGHHSFYLDLTPCQFILAS